ncbi:MAG: hypothetical protein NE327_02425 [Lentisphaeraceae bacterium]|nr:hypothetical protein [Lentisphaeraceae bacterium]
MEVSAVSGTEALESSTQTDNVFGQSFIGKEGFLKLLITQLQNQDPLEPMSNEDFAAQLAQFSSLEQMQNLNENFGQLMDLTKISGSANLIGKTVQYMDEGSGLNLSGVVDKVLIKSDGLYFSIDGKQINSDLVKEVGPTQQAAAAQS